MVWGGWKMVVGVGVGVGVGGGEGPLDSHKMEHVYGHCCLAAATVASSAAVTPLMKPYPVCVERNRASTILTRLEK